MPKRIDLTGQKFGRLTVIKAAPPEKKYDYKWSCFCACGKIVSVDSAHLKSGHSRSCGCLHKEQAVQNGHANKRHGMTRSPTYLSWVSMVQRCTNPNDPEFPNYGARGIGICEEWQSFDGFFSDMGIRPKGKTLGRIDNSKPYTRQNCRWETLTQQARNKRTNHIITYAGRALCLSEWVEITRIPRSTLKYRIRRGWPPAEILKEWLPIENT